MSPEPTDLPTDEVPATADLDPANEFLGTRVTQMDDAELDAYITNLRMAASGAIQVKKLCSLAGLEPKEKKVKKAKINIASLL